MAESYRLAMENPELGSAVGFSTLVASSTYRIVGLPIG
jgi:hypothetical protein